MDTLLSMKVFCQVVQSGSFTRAAELLDISTPMASKHIAHLEKTLSARLLYRTNRRLKLTEQGEDYYRDCLRALEILNHAAQQAGAGRNVPEGALKVSMPVWFGCGRFAAWMVEYQHRYPEVETVFTLTNRHVDLDGEGEDVALRLSTALSENLIARHLTDIGFYLVAAPSYLARFGTPKTAADLLRHRAVLPDYTDMARTPAVHDGKTVYLETAAKTRSNNTRMLAAMIKAGAGIGYMPGWLAEEDMAAGRLVRLLPEYSLPPLPLYAVYTNRKFMRANVRSFIDFLTEKCRQPAAAA